MHSPKPIQVVIADLSKPDHQKAVLDLTKMYAQDEMGNSGPLPEEVMQRLIPALRAHPTTVIFLAMLDDQPVGIATCFRGFSTFAARPLINIHDLAVHPQHRGCGIGQMLLQAVEQQARRENCAKLTLEVQAYNHRAQQVYAQAGFLHGSDAHSPGPLFLHKPL